MKANKACFLTLWLSVLHSASPAAAFSCCCFSCCSPAVVVSFCCILLLLFGWVTNRFDLFLLGLTSRFDSGRSDLTVETDLTSCRSSWKASGWRAPSRFYSGDKFNFLQVTVECLSIRAPGKLHSGAWFRSTDLWVMSPTR